MGESWRERRRWTNGTRAGAKRRIARVFEIWAVGAGGRVAVVFVSGAVRGDALVVDDLLEVPHGHGRPSKVVQLALFLLRALGVRLDPLLVRHELLLHEQPVLDALELELTQHALARRGDVRQAVSTVHALLLHLLAHARGRRGGLPLLLLRLLLLAILPPGETHARLVLPHGDGRSVERGRSPSLRCDAPRPRCPRRRRRCDGSSGIRARRFEANRDGSPDLTMVF